MVLHQVRLPRFSEGDLFNQVLDQVWQSPGVPLGASALKHLSLPLPVFLFFSVFSHHSVVQLQLIYMVAAFQKNQKGRKQSKLKGWAQTGTASLLPHFIGQSNSQVWVRIKGRRNRIHSPIFTVSGGYRDRKSLWCLSLQTIYYATLPFNFSGIRSQKSYYSQPIF